LNRLIHFIRFFLNRLLGWFGRYYQPGKTLPRRGGFVYCPRIGEGRPSVDILAGVQSLPEKCWPVETEDIRIGASMCAVY